MTGSPIFATKDTHANTQNDIKFVRCRNVLYIAQRRQRVARVTHVAMHCSTLPMLIVWLLHAEVNISWPNSASKCYAVALISFYGSCRASVRLSVCPARKHKKTEGNKNKNRYFVPQTTGNREPVFMQLKYHRTSKTSRKRHMTYLVFMFTYGWRIPSWSLL